MTHGAAPARARFLFADQSGSVRRVGEAQCEKQGGSQEQLLTQKTSRVQTGAASLSVHGFIQQRS